MTLSAHKAPVSFVVFSPDGKRVVTVADTLLKIWDPETGAEVSSFVEVRRCVGGGHDVDV